jgi:ubiquinone/menaquinone biosynthesis C-methylase UbiE
MSYRNTDKEWELFGKKDAYYGVLSNSRFHKKNLTSESRYDFFESGREDIEMIMRVIDKDFGGINSAKRFLDFGCGTGRTSIPLSKYAEHVVGVDVSSAMLTEARKNSRLRSIKNIEFIQSDDNLSMVTGKFDFIYSIITFQHISIKRGEKIFAQLIDKLNEGGIGSVHFVYERNIGWLKRVATKIKKYLPFSKEIINLAQGKNLNYPIVQMNCYDINKLLRIVQSKAASKVSLKFTKHAEYYGVIIFLQK